MTGCARVSVCLQALHWHSRITAVQRKPGWTEQEKERRTERQRSTDTKTDRQIETGADRHRLADRQTSRQVNIMQTSRQTVGGELFVVGWLLNVPATGECISGTDLHRQLYVLPH